jgi:hypothetical protein
MLRVLALGSVHDMPCFSYQLCMLPDLCSEALEALISLGIPRVLTSGGQPSAMQVRGDTLVSADHIVPKLQ